MKVRSKIGDLRVWNIKRLPGTPEIFPVENRDHAVCLINALARSQLLQPEITDNSFGFEVFTEHGWEEWEDPETGDSIDEYLSASA